MVRRIEILYFFFLCRSLSSCFLCLCFLIFLRRFLTTLPIILLLRYPFPLTLPLSVQKEKELVGEWARVKVG